MGSACYSQTNIKIEELKSEGAVPENDRSNVNNNIDEKLEDEAKINAETKKFLLLGTGSAGKTTVFNQLSYIYNIDLDNDKVLGQKKITAKARISYIRDNCFKTIKMLFNKAQELYNKNNTLYKDCMIDSQNEKTQESLKYLNKLPNDCFSCELENVSKLNQDQINNIGKHIKHIWSLNGIKGTFERKELFCIIENIDYFFDKVTEIMNKDYAPSPDDILRTRIITTGIFEKRIIYKDVPFIIVDVGGQRNERRKWISQFSDITALIYVSAMNHYCRVLFEDETKIAMIESIETFEQIVNYKLFFRKHVIMFLNKMDLFDKCIRDGKSLSLCFGKKWNDYPNKIEYTPKEDAKEDKELFDKAKASAMEFIKEEYKSVSKWNRQIYFHLTIATDKKSIEKVFWDVQNMVISKNLHHGGLL